MLIKMAKDMGGCTEVVCKEKMGGTIMNVAISYDFTIATTSSRKKGWTFDIFQIDHAIIK